MLGWLLLCRYVRLIIMQRNEADYKIEMGLITRVGAIHAQNSKIIMFNFGKIYETTLAPRFTNAAWVSGLHSLYIKTNIVVQSSLLVRWLAVEGWFI